MINARWITSVLSYSAKRTLRYWAELRSLCARKIYGDNVGPVTAEAPPAVSFNGPTTCSDVAFGISVQS